jgi:hypothetical protein
MFLLKHRPLRFEIALWQISRPLRLSIARCRGSHICSSVFFAELGADHEAAVYIKGCQTRV